MKTTLTAQQIQDLYKTDPSKACRAALRATSNAPWKQRLEAIDKFLGTSGTEAIRGEWQNGYWCDIVASYCNTGETYDLTVLHVRGDGWNPAGRFIVTSWGDWVEKNGEKMGVQ
jgi:hypothetical protein